MKIKSTVYIYPPSPGVSQICSLLPINSLQLSNKSELKEYTQAQRPDVILFNYNMDDDFSQISELRAMAEFSKTPVLCLFKKSPSPETITKIIHAGADNFVTLPIESELLNAYMVSLLRRKGSYSNFEKLNFGSITLDLNDNRCLRGNQDLGLTPIEFEIFKELVLSSGNIVSRDELKTKLKIYCDNSDIALNVHVHSVRKKLDTYGRLVKTIRARGYLLQHPEQAHQTQKINYSLSRAD